MRKVISHLMVRYETDNVKHDDVFPNFDVQTFRTSGLCLFIFEKFQKLFFFNLIILL